MSRPADDESDQRGADSAGVPWAGRSFEPNANAADDGSAPHAFSEAITRFRAGEARVDEVIDALRHERLLMPLVAELGDSGVGAHGQLVDKSQELSIVTVAAPDGRTVLPAFSDVAAMARWDATARPIPTPVRRIALAAADEGTDLIVVDPGSDTEFVIRRPAVWAIARDVPWEPSFASPEVFAALTESVAPELAVIDVGVASGDPLSRLRGPELIVRLELMAGLDRGELDAVLARLAKRWAADDRIAVLVDSLTVKLVRSQVEGVDPA
jgi:hypothetical protein